MKRNLSKLTISKKLNFFKDYVKETELFFLNEMIFSLELTGSNTSKKDNPKKNVTINTTQINNEKQFNNGNKSKKLVEKINDPKRETETLPNWMWS